MNNPTLEPPANSFRTAITVINSGAGPELCPFFGKCDGILIFDADGDSKEFHANEPRTSDCLCELLVAAKPDRLICGYVGEAEKKKLLAAGIDVRLGSCTCSIDELAACFRDLPEA